MRIVGLAALWFIAAGTVVLASLPPEEPRIAIITGSGAGDLSALVMTELAPNETIRLVERDDLAKVGDEIKLRQLAGANAVTLGKLLGADGLLFLNKTPNGIQMRFTAVGLGYALFDDQTPSDTDLRQLAKSLAHRVAGYASKLKLDPARAIPISILNLRADYATANSTTLERKLTLLLESRLASLPEYVVLERRHAWSLSFERSLNTTNPTLLHGAYVIDGTLTIPVQNAAAMTVHLRLRRPNGQEINSTIEGLPSDLPGLVNKVASEINKVTSITTTTPIGSWGNEAHEYLLEGLWGWENKVDAVALEALDSADLLGGNPADVTAVRIQVLSNLIDKGMEGWEPFWNGGRDHKPTFDATQLSLRTDLALRAIDDVTRYRDENLELRLQAFNSVDSGLRPIFNTHGEEERVVYRVSKLLTLLDEANSPRADELRHALRSVTGYDPLHGQMGYGFFIAVNVLDCSEVFADHWAQNLDEELAYYRLACSNKKFFIFDGLAPHLGDLFCGRFLQTPEQRLKAFDEFTEGLKTTNDHQIEELISKTNSKDQIEADSAYEKLLSELWNRREELLATLNYTPLLADLGQVSKDVKIRKGALGISLLHYYLISTAIPQDEVKSA